MAEVKQLCSCGRAHVGDVEQLPAAQGQPRATLHHGAERCAEAPTDAAARALTDLGVALGAKDMHIARGDAPAPLSPAQALDVLRTAAELRECDACGHRGTTRDADPLVAHCTHCSYDCSACDATAPLACDVCPCCSQDALARSCSLCNGQYRLVAPLTDEVRGAIGVVERATSSTLSEVMTERARQDAKWGGPAHDDEHSVDDWCGFLAKHTRRAADAVDEDEARMHLLRVAALAVAAIEAIDRRDDDFAALSRARQP